jgi:hypothetical protein
MSSCERTAWIRLVTILVVFVPYFWLVGTLFAHEDAVRAKTIYVLFVIAAVAHGVLNGIAQAISGTVLGKPIKDERDRAIEALALRIAYYTLISLILGALGTLATLGFLSPPNELGRIPVPSFVLTSQYTFCSCVLSEALRHVVQVLLYRKAAWS